MAKNNWSEWQHFVLNELKRQNDDHAEMKKDVNAIKDGVEKLKVSLAVMRVKSSAMGFLGGTIGFVIYQFLEGKLHF